MTAQERLNMTDRDVFNCIRDLVNNDLLSAQINAMLRDTTRGVSDICAECDYFDALQDACNELLDRMGQQMGVK